MRGLWIYKLWSTIFFEGSWTKLHKHNLVLNSWSFFPGSAILFWVLLFVMYSSFYSKWLQKLTSVCLTAKQPTCMLFSLLLYVSLLLWHVSFFNYLLMVITLAVFLFWFLLCNWSQNAYTFSLSFLLFWPKEETLKYILWFFFIFGLNFIFLCFRYGNVS